MTYEQLPTVYPPNRLQRSPGRWRSLSTYLLLILGYTALSGYLYLTRVSVPVSIHISSTIQSTSLYRDARPLQTIERYHDIAIDAIASRGLDTCNDKLGTGILNAYERSRLDYALGASTIQCVSVKADPESSWWPVPEAPCFARNISASDRSFSLVNSSLTSAGQDLNEAVGHERFLGTNLGETDTCGSIVDRTLLIVRRQDQFNPYHVGEDMVTTVLTALLANRIEPAWREDPVQLVFDDDFGIEKNHFVPMWDRIGAWAPRRLGMDPWKSECLLRSIHSIGAGVSLLSAGGVANRMPCASSITWAASLYYRHLFGLEPIKAVNVLWLSRAKFDDWAMANNDWSRYRAIRHINNEPELVDRLHRGLRAMNGYEEVDDIGWMVPGGIRFASLDPSVHSLETQIRYLGHASIVIGSHGGAMGLTLFMPPGQGTIIELAVPEVAVNRHFDIIASHLGIEYEQVRTEQTVDVEAVWEVVRKHVRNR